MKPCVIDRNYHISKYNSPRRVSLGGCESKLMNQFLKPPSDTLLRYFNMFHLAPTPSSLQFIKFPQTKGNKFLQFVKIIIYSYLMKGYLGVLKASLLLLVCLATIMHVSQQGV
jgi:hypothetical protein